MLDPDQHMASVIRKAGQEDLANAIQGNPTFRCDIALTGRERCDGLTQVHQRQQLLSDALALALALSVAVIVGQIAVIFVGAVGTQLRRMRPRRKSHVAAIEQQRGVVSDG